MNILVLSQSYPNNNGSVSLMYVHTRNKYYALNGINVTVLSFSAKKNYKYEGIEVITLEKYKKSSIDYDMLLIHAPNIKNHLRFLNNFGKDFNKILFFFHGHEVLNLNKVYPTPYRYMKRNHLKVFIQNIYDSFKLRTWRYFLTKYREKSYFVFVSRWMYIEFLKWTKIDKKVLNNRYSITYNGIGSAFENFSYKFTKDKEYDFITIRNNLDGSKYCIDLISDIAKRFPNYKFLVIGKGEYYNFNEKPNNITLIKESMNHEQILYYMNEANCALMPTRTDAQGLMMCEMASTGMPLITSNISIAHEIFDNWDNVGFIENEFSVDISKPYEKLMENAPYKKNEKYYNKNTISKELKIINKFGGNDYD